MRILRHFRVPRALFWAVVNQTVLSAGAFLIVFVLSRFLDYATFGGIRFLAAVLAISAFFSLPGISYVLMQNGDQLSARDAVRMLRTQMRWGLGAAVAGIAFFFYYLRAGNSDLAYGFLISGLFAPFANLYLMPGFILASQKRFKAKAYVDGAIMAVVALGAGYGAWATRTIAGTVLYYFGLQTTVTAFMLWIVMRALPASAPAHSDVLPRDTRYGMQLTVFQLPFTLLPSLEKVLVFLLLGPANLAFFIVAALPAEHAKNALRSLFQFYIFPHIEHRASDALARWFRLATTLVMFAILAAALFVAVAFPFFFPRYMHMYPFALALIVALVPLPAQVLTLSWIASKNIDRLRAFAYTITAADIVLFMALGAWGGLAGVFVAKIIVEFFGAALIAFLNIPRNTENAPGKI